MGGLLNSGCAKLARMALIAIVETAWGWTGLAPEQIVGDNDFGNLMIKDRAGRYWRICPEDLYCKIVANDRGELDALSRNRDFLHDWSMIALVQEAERALGALRPGDKYCLKIPGPLGGEYGGANLARIPLGELIATSGEIARQIADLPDGAEVQLSIVG